MTNNFTQKNFLAMVFVLFLLLSTFECQSGASALTIRPEEVRDYWPTTGWRTSIPEEQGMNSTKLDQMVKYVEERNFAIDSMVVVRNGYIVLEEYPNPEYNQNARHICYSATKSFTSALIGIAIQKGFIENVDQSVMEIFPEQAFANLDIRKQRMTLEHLLTMSTGLEWDEWSYPYMDSQGNPDFRNTYIQMIYSGDSIQFVLDRPMANEPGTVWNYNSGASHLLAAIIEQTTGYTTLNFAQKFLFGSLGISDVEWGQDPQGLYYGGHGLYLRPCAMAKFGYLFLNNGTWHNEQIVSTDWVTRSTETAFLRGEYGYGFQWWSLPTSGIYFASGLYGQKIIVIPEYDLVVVFTATIKGGSNPELGLLFDYIIPAVIGDSTTVSEFDILMIPKLIVLVTPLMRRAVDWIVRRKEIRKYA